MHLYLPSVTTTTHGTNQSDFFVISHKLRLKVDYHQSLNNSL